MTFTFGEGAIVRRESQAHAEYSLADECHNLRTITLSPNLLMPYLQIASFEPVDLGSFACAICRDATGLNAILKSQQTTDFPIVAFVGNCCSTTLL